LAGSGEALLPAKHALPVSAFPVDHVSSQWFTAFMTLGAFLPRIVLVLALGCAAPWHGKHPLVAATPVD
jgi:hypothetical protein